MCLKADPKPSGCINALDTQISLKAPYQYLYIGNFMPSDQRERYQYVQELSYTVYQLNLAKLANHYRIKALANAIFQH